MSKNAKNSQKRKIDNEQGSGHVESDVVAKSGVGLLISASGKPVDSSILRKICEEFSKSFSKYIRSEISENFTTIISDLGSSLQSSSYEYKDDERMFCLLNSKVTTNTMLSFDNSLVKCISSFLMGSTERDLDIDNRAITPLEKKVFNLFLNEIVNCLNSSFSTYKRMDFSLASISDFKDLELMDHSMMYKFSLLISIYNIKGNIDFIMPYSAIEQVKEYLVDSYTKNNIDRDPRWLKHMEAEVYNMNVTLELVADGSVSSIKELIDLSVGNTLILDKMSQDLFSILLNGVRISMAKLGKYGDKVAMQLVDEIDISKYNSIAI
ncbi:flagellar motor switch protein FliM [Candidatus Cyrtobacter comes]|uniref:Flagellar motor switch protein FliM n=1 Tax=Candidatus Cyrtobacter comes TaxID=675776 RepID=A0ABU5L8D3_9RICK|nr:FliM/FliN family flagellar motor switch protein [Candidatus Cyrtobacter comes]MDZ5762373.1 flagellar motor switch protein FliM [Candidatus Cyrtobacter comes]